MKPLNQAVQQTPPSGIRRFFDVASQMPDAISLGVGEPDFVTPWRIREAGIHAIERGYTTYTSNAGLLELREAIASHLEGRYGVSYDPATEILVTVGVSEGLDLALRALLNPGDEVLHLEPGYVAYGPGICFAGGVPVAVKTTGHDGFRIRPEALRAAITPRTKAILLAYPNNPTGATLGHDEVAAVVRVAVEHDLYIASDEIYARLTYGGEHTCAAALPGARERTVVMSGFSKAYAMTGWRVGYVCAPPPIAESMLKLHQYTMLCAPHMAQKAAVEALRHGESDVRRMVSEYDRRRRFLVRGLNAIGLECHEPRGAFYAFPSIRSTGLCSEEFATRLLREERVAVVPGNSFGETGEGHIRCSYATSMERLEQALERMERFVRSLSGPGLSAGEERHLAARA